MAIRGATNKCHSVAQCWYCYIVLTAIWQVEVPLISAILLLSSGTVILYLLPFGKLRCH